MRRPPRKVDKVDDGARRSCRGGRRLPRLNDHLGRLDECHVDDVVRLGERPLREAFLRDKDAAALQTAAVMTKSVRQLMRMLLL